MQTHSLFKSPNVNAEKEKKTGKELIKASLVRIMESIHQDMEKKKETLIKGGVSPSQAAELISKKEQQTQREALENFELFYKEKFKEYINNDSSEKTINQSSNHMI